MPGRSAVYGASPQQKEPAYAPYGTVGATPDMHRSGGDRAAPGGAAPERAGPAGVAGRPGTTGRPAGRRPAPSDRSESPLVSEGDPALSARAQDGPARVLLVLDQPVLAGVIELALAHVHGRFRARLAPTAAAAIEVLTTWQPHLAVVDMDLARGEMLVRLGYAASPAPVRVPVVALTRRGDLRAKLAAFEQGVDDILSVPFSPEELVARILAVLRRAYPEAAALRPVLRLGALEIDLLNRRVRAGEATLHLTSLELSLLYLLAANAGRLLTRDEILDHLWGVDYAAESNVVDRHVRNLRAKLRDDWRRPRYIATVAGRGYRFLPTAADADAAMAAVPAMAGSAEGE